MRPTVKDRKPGICVDCGNPTKRPAPADYCTVCQEKHRQQSLTSQYHRQNALENSRKRMRQVQFLTQNGLDPKRCKPVPQTVELVKSLKEQHGEKWYRHLPADLAAFHQRA